MANLWLKPWVTCFEKNPNFFQFLNFFLNFWIFYSLERRFFVLGYRRTDFPGLYCLKPWLNNSFRQEPLALENLNFSTVWTFCFYSVKKRFFVLEYRKTHFPGRYWLKRKRWKNGELLTKTMGESFWISTFRLFELVVFIA